jgi:hypothetical protein
MSLANDEATQQHTEWMAVSDLSSALAMVRGAARALRALEERCDQLEAESEYVARNMREHIRQAETALLGAHKRTSMADAQANLHEGQLATLIEALETEFAGTIPG